MSDQELYEAKRVQIERSPTVKVAYHRKKAERIGSLSPDLIKMLNDKHHIGSDKEVFSQESKRKKKEISRATSNKAKILQESTET